MGEWKNDKMWGKGVYTWADGQEYQGEWYGDSKGGLGVYYWPNGQKYSGEFLQGQISGRGIYLFEDGEKYIGEHNGGIMDGKGKYFWNSGLVFNGEFVKGDREFGTYLDREGKLLNVEETALQIIGELFKPQMTDREKVKVLHDYIVLNTTYDQTYYDKLSLNRESHTAYGVLEKQLAVCDGYAETLQYLLTLAGLESMIVKGEASGERGWEGHAGVIVKVNGTYRHLDATWDDPDTGNMVLDSYFLISDETMARDHRWDKEAYPACP